MHKITATLAMFALLSLASRAWSAEQRVAVLQPDDEAFRAISLALSPWELATVRSEAPLPSASQPEGVRMATQLAQGLRVQAIVWITRVEEGSLLWVFDAGTGDVTTRLLSETPPFDSAAAAAVALSVKTVLRASAIAPPMERGVSPSPPLRNTRQLGLEGGGGAYWIGEQTFEPRGRLAGTLWFAAAPRLGLTLEATAGAGLPVVNSGFAGRYQEMALGANMRLELLRTRSFATSVALGGSAHLASLRGTLDGTEDRSASRFNGALDLETAANFYLSRRAYLGVAAAGAYFPRYRRYLVGDDTVFAPWPLVVSLTTHVGVDLF